MKFRSVEYEGEEPLICIWAQPYKHGGPAKDALGWFTPQEASALVGLPAADIVRALECNGVLDTRKHALEFT